MMTSGAMRFDAMASILRYWRGRVVKMLLASMILRIGQWLRYILLERHTLFRLVFQHFPIDCEDADSIDWSPDGRFISVRESNLQVYIN